MIVKTELPDVHFSSIANELSTGFNTPESDTDVVCQYGKIYCNQIFCHIARPYQVFLHTQGTYTVGTYLHNIPIKHKIQGKVLMDWDAKCNL